MKPTFAPILLILAAALSMLWPTSCTPSPEHSRLTHIESIVDDHPDSALTLLQSIDTTAIRSKADRALYAMLLTEALDKNHQALTNDSLISEAIDYFALNGDPRREMIATYYGGRTQYSLGAFSNAIARFFRAKDIADELDENFWHGMAARGIADIFGEFYNFNEQLRFSKEELEYIRLSGRQPYINYALLDLAMACYNAGNHEDALALAHELIDAAGVWNDTYLKKEGIKIIGVHYITEQHFDKALPLFEEICSGDYADAVDSVYLCLSLSGIGQYHKADSLNKLISEKDDIATSSIKYESLKALNDTSAAFMILQDLFTKNVSEYKNKIRSGFSNNAVNYYKMSREDIRRELKSKKIIWALTVTVGLLLTLIFIGIFVYTIQRKNRQIEAKVTFANELNEQLKDMMKSHDSLQEAFNQSIEENKASQTLIQSNQETTRRLLASRFDLLDELSRIVTENTNTKISNRKIADKVTSLINDFTIGGNVIAEIERQIDEVHDNLMADLRQLLPDLKEDDYRLFMFSVLGFSSTVISLFLNEDKIKAVYNRKARLKTKIQTLDEQNYKRFMSFIE